MDEQKQQPEGQRESATVPQEYYKGEDIDHVDIDPPRISRVQRIRVALKDGTHLAFTAELDVTKRGINACMSRQRGGWGRLGPDVRVSGSAPGKRP